MSFRKTKTFGPHISLTDRQCENLQEALNKSGLTCDIENSWTGSAYIMIGFPEWGKDIKGDWYNDLDCGCNDDIAKIRLSGHEEGLRSDSTHNAVGTKRDCLKALKQWIDNIIEKNGPKGLTIVKQWSANTSGIRNKT